MFNTVVIISTTQVQSDVDRVVHFRLTWYLLTTFRQHRNLFFKVWLQIFRRRVPASSRCLQCPPIRRCIINLYQYLYHQTVCHRNIQGISPKRLSQKWFIFCIIILFIMTYESIFSARTPC